MKIRKYKTDIPNFYLFVSHGKGGKAICTYGLVSDDNKTMIEVSPQYGPITVLEHEDILNIYIKNCISLDRGGWSQIAFDEADLSTAFSMDNFQYIVTVLSEWLDR